MSKAELITKNNSDIEELVDQLINEDSIDKSKEMINLFNVNIAKKNTLRVLKVNELLDKVNEEAIKRVDESSDTLGNNDLINYMKAAQIQLDKSYYD